MLSVGVKKVLPVVVVSVCQRRTIKWTNVIIIMSLICIMHNCSIISINGFLTTRITKSLHILVRPPSFTKADDVCVCRCAYIK